MAELKLNTTTSIVDFLKSQGKPSDFRSRETMFRESGLEDRLGTFVGSGSQNVALLRRLQTEQVKPEAPVAPVAAPEVAPEVAVPPQLAGIVPPGTSATDALKILGIPEVPTIEQVTQTAFESPAFKLFQEKQDVTALTQQAMAEAGKAKLETAFEADRKTLEDALGRRGLGLSGIRTSQVQALVENLAASKLGIDRALAGRLLTQNIELKEQVLKSVEEVIKSAQAGRKEAVSALKDIGLAVVGNQVVPTLAARQAEATQERFETSQATTQARFEQTAKRLEAAASRGTPAQQKTAELTNITNQLNTAIGTDGFTNADTYQKLRATATISASDFDNRFKSLLSPENRTKLGIKSGNAIDDKLDAYGL